MHSHNLIFSLTSLITSKKCFLISHLSVPQCVVIPLLLVLAIHPSENGGFLLLSHILQISLVVYCGTEGEILFLCLLDCLLFMLGHCSSFTRLSWTLISTYGRPSSLEWATNAVSKHSLPPCMSPWKIASFGGPQAHQCGALHSIQAFNWPAQFPNQTCTKINSRFIQTSVSIMIKARYKMMLEASLNGETWHVWHLLQPPSLLSCPWRRLMWFVPDKCSSAVSFLLVGHSNLVP